MKQPYSVDEIIDYYLHYDEETRLERHPVEFIVSTYVLEKYVTAPGRLLDVAAGTGRYAIHFSRKGLNVWAEDLVPSNIEILRAKPEADSSTFRVRTNDARDLSAYRNEFFDTVFYMGPIYHLPKAEALPALMEATRVLKTEGIIAISFVNKFPGYRKDQYAQWINYHSNMDVISLVKKANLCVLRATGTDGPLYSSLAALLRGKPTSDAIQDWLESHDELIEWTAEHESCFHGLVVARKMAT